VMALLLFTLKLARLKNLSVVQGREIIEQMRALPKKIESILDRAHEVEKIADDFKDATNFLYLGRGYSFPTALEGALKLKELAYVSAEGFPAGEIKHGPIALVEEGTPVWVLAPRHALQAKLVNNVQEVRARGARTIVVATDGDDSVTPYADHLIRVPDTKSLCSPMLSIVPMQVLACEVALVKGLDVDQPRNLAKSVTVE